MVYGALSYAFAAWIVLAVIWSIYHSTEVIVQGVPS